MKQGMIVVALVGDGPVAKLLEEKIGVRADLQLALQAADASAVIPSGTHCLVFVPGAPDVANGSAATHIAGWLRAGINVVSTLPADAVHGADLLAACREGRATYHGTGGHQTRLVSRFNRAFASITRNIRAVELVEERAVAQLPAADAPMDECFYSAGLHTLADAAFGNLLADDAVNAHRVRHAGDDALTSRIGKNTSGAEQLIVRRTLGEHLAYDTVFSCGENSAVPLRYRLNTQSSDAIGHVTIEFHAGNGVDPADHLACGGLLDAIKPVCESRPGILRHELGINQVQLNDCLA